MLPALLQRSLPMLPCSGPCRTIIPERRKVPRHTEGRPHWYLNTGLQAEGTIRCEKSHYKWPLKPWHWALQEMVCWEPPHHLGKGRQRPHWWKHREACSSPLWNELKIHGGRASVVFISLETLDKLFNVWDLVPHLYNGTIIVQYLPVKLWKLNELI